MMKKIVIFLIAILFIQTANCEEISWDFLDTKTIGAHEFIGQNPESDGRGTIVYILDCGVDPAIPGLTTTSTGRTKVVEIMDFSGQIELFLTEADKDTTQSAVYLKGAGVKIEGWQQLGFRPADGKYYISELSESRHFKNSSIEDINSNDKKDDSFAILAFPVDNAAEILKNAPGLVKPGEDDEIWVYYADQDADGHIDDEEAMFDYRYRFDIFNFYEGEKDKIPLLNLSANVDAKTQTMTINVCDGSHGTHCAGIAAGNDIYGTAGNNGIAPGAYVASFKIGDNTLSGGSTTLEAMKKAYKYGIEFMEKAGFDHAVYSMSYGISSETPGRSDIEKFLERFALKHPEVVIITSNGNNGPGINSTGNPSASDGLISVGAMISPATLDNLYGSPRNKHWITNFSSRGGESAKPDVIAPGAAMSTVPRFTKWEAFWGTSMACPEVAGACAVLISKAEQDNLDFDGYMVMKAVKYSAEPLHGYTPADYGNGLVNIPKAYEYLKILARRDKTKEPAFYKINAANTFYPDLKGPAAFWKAGGYFPAGGRKQTISITPEFGDTASEQDRTDFYRPYRVRTDAEWIDIDKSKFYIHGETPGIISLTYDESKLTRPGLYSAKIYAYAEDEPNGGYPELDIQASVVIPYKFGTENSYTQSFESRRLSAGAINRFFIEIPPAATGMNIEMSSEGDEYSVAGMYVYSPDGRRQFHNMITSETGRDINLKYDEDKIMPGIWEIIPYGNYTANNPAEYDLDIRFYSVASDPEVIESVEYPAGEKPTGAVKLINRYSREVEARASGSIDGYAFNEEITIENAMEYSREFKAAEDDRIIEFEIEMSAEDYNKFTDIPVSIFDQNGKLLLSTGISGKYETIRFSPPEPGEYTMQIASSFTDAASLAEPLTYWITEKHYFDKISIRVPTTEIKLYPGIEQEMEFIINGRPPMPPQGCYLFGNIKLIGKNSKAIVKEIDIIME